MKVLVVVSHQYVQIGSESLVVSVLHKYNVVAQISSFINCQAKIYTIQVIKCQQQSGCNDCGLFAIATATVTALCSGYRLSGILPSSRIWDQLECNADRFHLVNCFESRLMHVAFTGELEPNIV